MIALSGRLGRNPLNEASSRIQVIDLFLDRSDLCNPSSGLLFLESSRNPQRQSAAEFVRTHFTSPWTTLSAETAHN
jgi:hypothetical protein